MGCDLHFANQRFHLVPRANAISLRVVNAESCLPAETLLVPPVVSSKRSNCMVWSRQNVFAIMLVNHRNHLPSEVIIVPSIDCFESWLDIAWSKRLLGLLKMLAPVITEPLVTHFSVSLSSDQIPDDWYQAASFLRHTFTRLSPPISFPCTPQWCVLNWMQCACVVPYIHPRHRQAGQFSGNGL